MITSLAQRLRMTEGQAYSSVITLIVAVVLLFGLGDLHGVISTAVAQQPLPLAPATSPTGGPTGVVAVPPAQPLQPSAPLPVEPQPEPAPAPLPSDGGPGAEVPSDTPPTSQPTPSPTATASTCRVAGTQSQYDQAIALLKQVNAATGGKAPVTNDLGLTLGIVTGCNEADPATVVVGLLIGLGRTLPDPGVQNPVVVPFVTLPSAVVTAIQPARAAIDAACGLVGTGQTVASLFIGAYPQAVSQLTSQALFTALSVCGQVRTP